MNTTNHAAAVEIGGVLLLATTPSGLRLEATRDGDAVTFTGGAFGPHTLNGDPSDERIAAHWDGYVRATVRAIHGNT